MRRIVTRPSPPAAAIVDFVGPPRKKNSGATRRDVARIGADVLERARQDEGGPRNARELVALYAVLHAQVYGAPASELRGEVWVRACAAAKRMVREEFAGDFGEATEFLRWVWQREREREQYRRKRGEGGGRIGWVLQFAKGNLVTDYRVAQNRGLG